MIILEEIDEKSISGDSMIIDFPIDQQPNQKEIVENHLLSAFDFYEYAGSLEMARQLEENRALYFQELYDDIGCKTYSWGEERDLSDHSTSGQALWIIDAKDTYDRRIKKLKAQYSKWRKAISTLNEEDRKLMRRYFEGGHMALSSETYKLVEDIKRKIDYGALKN